MRKELWERKPKVGWGQNMEDLAATGQGEPLNSQSFPLSSPPVQIFLILQRAAQGHFLQEACANLSRRALSSAEVICLYRDLHSLTLKPSYIPALQDLSGTRVQCPCAVALNCPLTTWLPLGDEGMLTLRGPTSHSLPQEAFPTLGPAALSQQFLILPASLGPFCTDPCSCIFLLHQSMCSLRAGTISFLSPFIATSTVSGTSGVFNNYLFTE